MGRKIRSLYWKNEDSEPEKWLNLHEILAFSHLTQNKVFEAPGAETVGQHKSLKVSRSWLGFVCVCVCVLEYSTVQKTIAWKARTFLVSLSDAYLLHKKNLTQAIWGAP